MKVNITQDTLMQAGEEMFWEQMDVLTGQSGKRYIVIDKTSQTVLVKNARLVRETRRVEV